MYRASVLSDNPYSLLVEANGPGTEQDDNSTHNRCAHISTNNINTQNGSLHNERNNSRAHNASFSNESIKGVRQRDSSSRELIHDSARSAAFPTQSNNQGAIQPTSPLQPTNAPNFERRNGLTSSRVRPNLQEPLAGSSVHGPSASTSGYCQTPPWSGDCPCCRERMHQVINNQMLFASRVNKCIVCHSVGDWQQCIICHFYLCEICKTNHYHNNVNQNLSLNPGNRTDFNGENYTNYNQRNDSIFIDMAPSLNNQRHQNNARFKNETRNHKNKEDPPKNWTGFILGVGSVVFQFIGGFYNLLSAMLPGHHTQYQSYSAIMQIAGNILQAIQQAYE